MTADHQAQAREIVTVKAMPRGGHDYDPFIALIGDVLVSTGCQEYVEGRASMIRGVVAAALAQAHAEGRDEREAEVEGLKTQLVAIDGALSELAHWPELPGVVYGARLVDPETGKTEEIALRPEQLTGVMRAIDKHVANLNIYGHSTVEAAERLPGLEIAYAELRKRAESAEREVARLREVVAAAREVLVDIDDDGVAETDDVAVENLRAALAKVDR